MKIFCKVSDEDDRILYDSIVETEACKELYQNAVKSLECTPDALQAILDYYMHCLKEHKRVWKDMLVKYVGEDQASAIFRAARYDPAKKVVFLPDIEGCALCSDMKSN
jgi:hypothetical protein